MSATLYSTSTDEGKRRNVVSVLEARIQAETCAAVLVAGLSRWLPKSQIQIDGGSPIGKSFAGKIVSRIDVPRWLLEARAEPAPSSAEARVTVTAEVIGESEKGVKVRLTDAREIWLPKAQTKTFANGEISILRWLAERNGISGGRDE